MRQPVTVSVGDTHPERTVGPITQTDIVRFAGAGGDFNPLHHDVEFAARAGFDRPIAMGQLQGGMLAGWVSDWVGAEHLRRIEVRFVAPLAIGDTLVLRGRVTEIEETESGPVATIELSATKGDDVVVKGSARAAVTTR